MIRTCDPLIRSLNIFFFLILRVSLFSSSLLLIYASLSYETEEGKIQGRFGKWWIRVDDYRQQALSWHVALLKLSRLLHLLFSTLLMVFGPVRAGLGWAFYSDEESLFLRHLV